MSEEKPLRVGLIGCGDISPSHLRTYPQVGLELAALCDADTTRAEKRREEYGTPETPIYTDYAEMVKQPDIDIVTVATPVAFHTPMTLAALAAGKHVACEKPSALSLEENYQVREAAQKADKRVIYFSVRMRWDRALMATKYIEDGDLGDIYRIDVTYYRTRGRPGVDIIPTARWFANKKLAGGGIVMDMGQYFMDMVMNLAGWPQITSVSASTFKGFPYDLPDDVIFDVEEHCTLFARTESDLVFTYDFAGISNTPGINRITVLGTKGGIIMDGPDFKFYTEKAGPWRQVEHKSLWKDKTSGNAHAYEALISDIRNGTAHAGTSPDQAIAITKLTQMAFKSAAENRSVTPDEVEPA